MIRDVCSWANLVSLPEVVMRQVPCRIVELFRRLMTGFQHYVGAKLRYYCERISNSGFIINLMVRRKLGLKAALPSLDEIAEMGGNQLAWLTITICKDLTVPFLHALHKEATGANFAASLLHLLFFLSVGERVSVRAESSPAALLERDPSLLFVFAPLRKIRFGSEAIEENHSRASLFIRLEGKVIESFISGTSIINAWIESAGNLEKMHRKLLAFAELEVAHRKEKVLDDQRVDALVDEVIPFLHPRDLFMIWPLTPFEIRTMTRFVEGQKNLYAKDSDEAELLKRALLADSQPGYFIQARLDDPLSYTLFVKFGSSSTLFEIPIAKKIFHFSYTLYPTYMDGFFDDALGKVLSPEYLLNQLEIIPQLRLSTIDSIFETWRSAFTPEKIGQFLELPRSFAMDRFVTFVVMFKSCPRAVIYAMLDQKLGQLQKEPSLGFVIQKSGRDRALFRLFVLDSRSEVRELAINRREYAELWVREQGSVERMTALFQERLASKPDAEVIDQIERELRQASPAQDACYAIAVERSALLQHPLGELKKLTALFDVQVAHAIEVTFTGENGQDGGGLSREYLSLLVLHSLLALHCEEEGGYFIPKLTAADSSACEHFQRLGKLFAFCLFSRFHYPLGENLADSLFAAILALLRNPLALCLDSFEEVLALFKLAYPAKYAEVLNALKLLDRRSMTLKQAVMALPDLALESLDEAELEKKIKGFIFEKWLQPLLQPIFELAKGMQEAGCSLNLNLEAIDDKNFTAADIAEQVQGSLNPKRIVEKLEFDPGPTRRQKNWLRDWILKASRDDLRRFLREVTGSDSLGEISIKIHTTANVPENPQRNAFYSRSCFHRLEVPWHLITSQETLFKGLQDLIITEGYTNA